VDQLVRMVKKVPLVSQEGMVRMERMEEMVLMVSQ